MSERIVKLNVKVIKEQIKRLVCGSVEEVLKTTGAGGGTPDTSCSPRM